MQSRTDLIAERSAFAAALADALTAKTDAVWRVSEAPCVDIPSGGWLTDGDRRLHLYFNYSDRKVQVTGGYADEQRPGRSRVYLHPEVNGYKRNERPSIGVGMDRPAPRVAADIVRRLFPDYDAVRARIVEMVAEEDEDAASMSKAVASMADALGVERPRKLREYDNEPDGVHLYGAAGYGDFKSSYNGASWTIDLHSVSAEVAERIATVLREAREA